MVSVGTCMWRKGLASDIFLPISTLFLRWGLSLNLGLTLDELEQPASSDDLPHLLSIPRTRIMYVCHYAWPFDGCLGTKSRSLGQHGEHFMTEPSPWGHNGQFVCICLVFSGVAWALVYESICGC